MKAVNIIFYTVWLFIIAILQPTLMQWISILGINPNAYIIFIVAVAFIRGKEEAAVCGAVYGLVYDLAVGRLIGISGLLFMYLGLILGIAAERFLGSTGVVVSAILCFVAFLLYDIVYYIAYSMVWGDMSFITAFGRVILPECLYTTAISVIVFKPIKKSFKIIEKRNIY